MPSSDPRVRRASRVSETCRARSRPGRPNARRTVQNNFRVRKSFAKIQKIIDIPNLINIQKQSYEKFLQADVAPDKREDVGLQGVFKSVFPIRDFNETSARSSS